MEINGNNRSVDPSNMFPGSQFLVHIAIHLETPSSVEIPTSKAPSLRHASDKHNLGVFLFEFRPIFLRIPNFDATTNGVKVTISKTKT